MKFKKTLAAAIAAMMMIAMVSCGSSDSGEDEKEKEETTTTTPAETTTTTTAAETTTTPAETTTTTAPEEEADDSVEEIEASYEGGVFTHQLYTVTVDESKWEYTESAGVDCMFTYVGESDNAMAAATTFNVVSVSSSLLAGMTAEDYMDQITAAYESLDGATIGETMTISFGSSDAYQTDIEYEMAGVVMSMTQLIVSASDGSLVAITFGAEESAYEETSYEFEEVLDTLTVS